MKLRIEVESGGYRDITLEGEEGVIIPMLQTYFGVYFTKAEVAKMIADEITNVQNTLVAITRL